MIIFQEKKDMLFLVNKEAGIQKEKMQKEHLSILLKRRCHEM